MMTKKLNLVLILCVGSLALVGCSKAKKQLGLNIQKEAPDEFAVVKRAPLALPPNYTLRPPQPGAPRPQEQTTNEIARQTVFGREDENVEAQQSAPVTTSSEALLLQQAGAGNIDPAIRKKLDSEADIQAKSDKPAAYKLFGVISGDDQSSARVVDPKKEAERIRTNTEAGKPVTEGETPYKDE